MFSASFYSTVYPTSPLERFFLSILFLFGLSTSSQTPFHRWKTGLCTAGRTCIRPSCASCGDPVPRRRHSSRSRQTSRQSDRGTHEQRPRDNADALSGSRIPIRKAIFRTKDDRQRRVQRFPHQPDQGTGSCHRTDNGPAAPKTLGTQNGSCTGSEASPWDRAGRQQGLRQRPALTRHSPFAGCSVALLASPAYAPAPDDPVSRVNRSVTAKHGFRARPRHHAGHTKKRDVDRQAVAERRIPAMVAHTPRAGRLSKRCSIATPPALRGPFRPAGRHSGLFPPCQRRSTVQRADCHTNGPACATSALQTTTRSSGRRAKDQKSGLALPDCA